jgi:ABC-type branched-subunit amino acid transport system ATPase component
MDTETRVARGLGVVFGGGAVFGDLTVEANLRAGGQLLAKAPTTLASRIEEGYGLFPRLAERRSALGVQLSGGEQQMLALAKAFVLRPRLLCIDELSLGLAPVLVGRLLDSLRAFRAAGTTLLLVEQSVNVALSVADRIGYFERGEVRAVLEAEDARRRPDLLHALFLKGERA